MELHKLTIHQLHDLLVKKEATSKEITEDAKFKGHDDIQKLTEKYTKKIDELLANKEKELV